MWGLRLLRQRHALHGGRKLSTGPGLEGDGSDFGRYGRLEIEEVPNKKIGGLFAGAVIFSSTYAIIVQIRSCTSRLCALFFPGPRVPD